MGAYRSGFDHFCQFGHRGLSPHILFDDALYAKLYDDMSLDNLDFHRCAGRYDHWLKSGQRERRSAHPLFDTQFYRARAIAAGIDAAEIDARGPYVDYLYRCDSGRTELAPSAYFDPQWYRNAHTEARHASEAGLYRNALDHYLRNETPTDFDPVPEFSERYYAEAYLDISTSIEAGTFRNGYDHFIRYGTFELRRPRSDIDLLFYRDMNPRVVDDLNAGRIRDAFAHLRLIGLPEGLAHCPPERMPDLPEPATKALFEQQSRNALATFARARLDFTVTGAPSVSVIMVLRDKFDLTMQALASLRQNFAGAIDLILVDNGSRDETTRIATYVRGATILRNDGNDGFVLACNQALFHARADAVLYLNNDVTLGYGAVAAALARLARAPSIGAVGGKIVRSHGRLQEAGSIVWGDGTTTGYLRDAAPLAPEANFLRDVDYCSAVFLLCRASLLRDLGGFDPDFAPAYYEEADLCLRMIEAGARIVYDPAIVVHHLEFGSAGHPDAALSLMRRNRKKFAAKHAAFLQTRPEQGTASPLLFRARDDAGKRLLFLEDTVPLRRLGSGFVRANDIVHAIAAEGWRVSVYPVNGARYDVMSLFGDMPETAEILYDRTILTLAEHLAERQDFYDAIWISRTHNLDRTLDIFRDSGIDPAKTPFLLDTEAIEAARDAEAARLAGKDFDLDAALASEVANAGICRAVSAVNAAEASLLRRQGLPHVTELGTMRATDPTEPGFADRAGLLFVASIHQTDSPNLDSLRWYAHEIAPALAGLMDDPPKLTVAGHVAPGIDLGEFAGNPHLEIIGPVDDLGPLYARHRAFIAPTRFAAGTPYKIYEAASFGLPCVATDLLARQLGWTEGAEIETAPRNDAVAFAASIARLYRDAPRWAAIRGAALARLERENGAAAFSNAVRAMLARATATSRQ